MARQSDAVPVEARRRRRIDELCEAAIRALTGEPEVHLRARMLYRGDRPLPLRAPQLHPSPGDDFASFRGAADGMALRLLHSDAALHGILAPSDPVERLLFDMLEQFRVESLVADTWPGVRANLRHRHVNWSLSFHGAGLTEGEHGMVVYTVAQVCRAQVTAEPVVEETEDLLETTRGELAPVLGPDLVGLRRNREDQRAYAAHALRIARAVAGLIDDLGGEEVVAGEDPASARLPLFIDLEDDGVESTSATGAGGGALADGRASPYRPFTTDYDREAPVTSLVRSAQLRRLRESLDERVATERPNLPGLARMLRARLSTPVQSHWSAGAEEGHIDGRRLSRLISSPTERRLFQVLETEPVVDSVVSFLVDCSGSMKAHAEDVATLVDVLGRALEMAGATTEILGFTTGAWNGGRALRDWRRAGRPPRPGRLNEVTHIVFKDARTGWRQARPGVAGLLRQDLFREGVDGEAVQWACERLDARPERRRILAVLSDGGPMDTATSMTNEADFLDRHLSDVVQRWRRTGRVEIHGLGVGLDLSPYYRNAHALDLSQGLPRLALREVATLLTGGPSPESALQGPGPARGS